MSENARARDEKANFDTLEGMISNCQGFTIRNAVKVWYYSIIQRNKGS